MNLLVTGGAGFIGSHFVRSALGGAYEGLGEGRITGPALIALLEGGTDDAGEAEVGDAAPPAPREDKPTVSAASVDLEGVADSGDESGDAVNGDGS